MEILKAVIILVQIIFAIAMIAGIKQDKKNICLYMVMLGLVVANIFILAFNL
jgi:hypothetical protein